MAIIGLLFPSFISMAIYRKRSGEISNNWQSMLVRFGIYVLLDTWAVQALLTYLLGQENITESALTSFPFFTKYVVIASIIAIILPYAEEMLRKCIGVSVSFSTDDGKKENEE